MKTPPRSLTPVLLLAGLTGACSGPGSGTTSASQPGVTPVSAGPALSKSEMRERAIGVLSELAFDADPEVRANAIEGLQAVPTRVEPVVRAALSDQNLAVRYVAAMTVGQLKLRGSSALVRPLLDDPSPLVRAAAIFALHRNGQKQNLTPIADLLGGPNLAHAASAAYMLGELGDPSAAPMLRSAVKRSHYDMAASRNLQLAVAEALTKLGDQDAAHVLRAALYPNSIEGFEQAALAAQMLGEVGDEMAVAQLIRLVEQTRSGAEVATDENDFMYPPELRLAAATALARLGYPDGWYVGERYRRDPNPALRAQAAHTLGRTGLARDVAALSEMLGDRDHRVRAAAAAGILNAIERPTRPKPRWASAG